MAGFPIAPLNYLASRAARSYITGPNTSASVANPRANTPAGTVQSKPSGEGGHWYNDEDAHDIITSILGGFSMAPINYIAKKAARGFNRLTDEAAEELAGNYRAAQSKPSVKVPVSNPRANPAYAAQVFSPDYIDRIAKAHVTGQPVTLPEVTAPKSNTSAGTTQSKPSGVAQGQSSGEAQSKPSYDTNTLWG